MGLSLSSIAGNSVEDAKNKQHLQTLENFVFDVAENNSIAAGFSFSKPLSWTTILDEKTLSSLQSQVKPAGKGKVSADSLAAIAAVLKAADDKHIEELFQIVQGSDNLTSDVFGDELWRNVHNGIWGNLVELAEENVKTGRAQLLLAMDDHDVDHIKLHDADGPLSEGSSAQLTIRLVERELSLIRRSCGVEDEDSLDTIDWESTYTFSNGLRVPPWLQDKGDLAFIVCRPKDVPNLVIKCNIQGYQQVRGYDENSQELIDEPVGDRYATLVALLRAKSPHFAEKFDNQDISILKEVAEYKADVAPPLDLSSSTGSKGGQSDSASQASTAAKRTLQPSRRWATLGLGVDVLGLRQAGRRSRASVQRASQVTSARGPSSRRGGTLSSTQGRGTRKGGVASLSATRSPRSQGATLRKTSRFLKTGPLDFSDEEDEEEEEEEIEDKRFSSSELPPEYWSIQKLIKYLSAGNQTATMIALCCLRDHDLTNEACQYAVRKEGGLDVLVNLLETDDVKCKVGALQVLRDVSLDMMSKRLIGEMMGIAPLVRLLEDPHQEIRCLAAVTLANCAKLASNRRLIREEGGIEKAVALMQDGLKNGSSESARCGALVLWSSARSVPNRRRLVRAGALDILAQLLQTDDIPLLIPVVGVLEECASQQEYRDMIRGLGVVPFLVDSLSRDNSLLQAHAAMAIFKCAEDPDTRRMVRQREGLGPLVKLLANQSNIPLMEGVTGAIWKCAADPDNLAMFSKLKAVDGLVSILKATTPTLSENVLINVTGALAELAKNTDSNKAIRASGGIQPLVKLLSEHNETLLVNATKAVGATAVARENMDVIDKLDGVRYLWTLLKSSKPRVQASAAWAICPCVANARDAGALVRSFVGGLELVVGLLKSPHVEVQAAICAAIAQIAKDEENLAVITDHGVVHMLSRLVRTTSDMLRCQLARAVANCCSWGDNVRKFGQEDAVSSISLYLKSKDEEVLNATAHALNALSSDPENCVTMHENGVVQPLLDLVGSSKTDVQEAAASCLANMRRLALANEMANNA